MNRLFLLLLIILVSLELSAQHDLYKWKVQAYTSAAHYLNENYDSGEYTYSGENNLYRLELVKNTPMGFAFSVSSTFGKIRGLDFFKREFFTETKMASLRVYYHTDNDFILKSSSVISPYLFAGLGLSENETPYRIFRITSGTSLAVPFGAGLKIRLNDRLNLNLHSEVVYNTESHLRNPIPLFDSPTKAYAHIGLSLGYNFGFRKSTFTAPRLFVGEHQTKKPEMRLKEKDPVKIEVIPKKITGKDVIKEELVFKDSLKIALPDSVQKQKSWMVKKELKIVQDSVDADTLSIEKLIVQRDTLELEQGMQIKEDSLDRTVERKRIKPAKDSVVFSDSVFQKGALIHMQEAADHSDTLSIESERKFQQSEIKQKRDTVMLRETVSDRQPQIIIVEDKREEGRQDFDESRVRREPDSRGTVNERYKHESTSVPREISGGYIIAVRPDEISGASDTIPWNELKAYMQDLQEQNEALKQMLESQLELEDTLEQEETPSVYYSPDDQTDVIQRQLKEQSLKTDSLFRKLSDIHLELDSMRKSASIVKDAPPTTGIDALQDSIEALKGVIRKSTLKERDKVRMTSAKVFFKTSSTAVPVESVNDLNEIARTLNADKNLLVKVSGHSDRSGNAAFNLQLSKRRAESVALYLRKRGVKQSRIITEYFGEKFSKDPADPLDRRVEVLVIEIDN
ncbi:MAG: OmpA family protein [Bacteroidetes bacterium]|nr:MAG: OmpA family protein [Bacteroidota bacterium]REK00946.1 MAG: OmpA family protein [Bacteroidota bacterium]REK34549.1 MAG: OmpA family protein [Bacteroidota bacterium]REK51808.1 MAG: OmpA family protein [Bacteroidota bacterium]